MNKIVRLLLICVLLLIFVPGIVSAANNDFISGKLVFLEDKEIAKEAEGNVTVVAGDANIKSDIKGSLIVVFGKATVNKGVKIDGDVVSIFGDLDILKDCEVSGNFVSLGKIEKADGVKIKGSNVAVNIDIISLFNSNSILINALILLAIIILVAGFLLITAFPERYRVMSYAMESGNPRKMLLGGLVVINLTIILVFLIFWFAVPLIYIALLMFADIVASIFVGTLIFKNNYERSAIYLQFFVGHILISIFKIVPLILLPQGSYTALLIYSILFILLEFTLAFLGVGTILDTGFGQSRKYISKQ